MTTLIILSVALILVVVLMNEYGWTDLTGNTRNDLVFEERNKKYGAYEIRQKYGNRLIVAFFGMMGIMTLAAFSPKFFKSKGNIAVAKPQPPKSDVTICTFPEREKEEEKVFEQPEQPKQEQKQKQRNDISTFEASKPVASNKPQEKDTLQKDEKAIAGTSNHKGLDTLGNGSQVAVTTGTTKGCIDCNTGKEDNGGIRDVLEVEEEAAFPGGVVPYLQKHLKYPEPAASAGIEGKVYVEFVVNEDGSVNVKGVKKKVNEFLDQEAMRVIASMKGWKPAKFNKRSVKVRMIQPISFKLQK